MQPVEALRTVIDTTRTAAENWFEDEEARRLKAADVCEALLDQAIPLARFQCYVTVEAIGKKSKLGLGDYTICALTIPGLKNALVGLSMEEVTVYIQLWERMQEGTEMLSGYQGKTKNLGFRNWLADIDRFNAEREQFAGVVNGPTQG